MRSLTMREALDKHSDALSDYQDGADGHDGGAAHDGDGFEPGATDRVLRMPSGRVSESKTGVQLGQIGGFVCHG